MPRIPVRKIVAPLTLVSYRRAKSSTNGNPAWYVMFDGPLGYVEYRTQTDASIGYEVDNFKAGDIFSATISNAGHLVYLDQMTPAAVMAVMGNRPIPIVSE